MINEYTWLIGYYLHKTNEGLAVGFASLVYFSFLSLALLLYFSLSVKLFPVRLVLMHTVCWISVVVVDCVCPGRTPSPLLWPSWLPPVVKSALLLLRLLSPLLHLSRSLAGFSP